MKRLFFSRLLYAVMLLLLAGCGSQEQAARLSGATMGTAWHVTLVSGSSTPESAALQTGIEDILQGVDRSMSTYREDSEISRFNRAPVATWYTLSPPFVQVLAAALDVGRHSEGAYDVTVAPLVDLWGFGPTRGAAAVPDAPKIAQLLAVVGQDKLRLDVSGSRAMKQAPLSLDFSSIAKGYAVDAVADWLLGQGVARFMVEVGGEVRVAGRSPRGDAWRIAIERPDSGARSVAAALAVTDVAVATSGDYRNFFELDGVRYSHSIDPRTGYPVAHDLVSVTVIADSAMLADAWATALEVLGSERATAVAQQRDLAVYFIRRVGDNYQSSYTDGFAQYLADGPR